MSTYPRLTDLGGQRPTHETAEDWYEAYGWHVNVDDDDGGSITHPPCTIAELADEPDDEALAARLIGDEEVSQAYRDAMECAVAKAREIADVAESLEADLERAVDGWQAGKLDEVLDALDSARRTEEPHGDTPATDALREQLVASIEVDRYSDQDGIWWIVVGDTSTARDVADGIARAELHPGEALEYDGRDEDCGGPVYRITTAEVAS